MADVQQISPTLGEDQLTAGLIAGVIGLVLVVVYSLLYYRGLGLVTVFSLVIAGLLTYALLVLLGETIGYTLTLAGIAGAIVAIGITADSFVVYFERIRDEMRDRQDAAGGRRDRAGAARAGRIVAADLVSLLAAIVLYVLSVGGVRGFAFTLGLTTLVDLFVVFLFTKPVVTLLAGTKFFGGGHPLSGLDPDRLGVKRPDPTRASGRPSVPAGGLMSRLGTFGGDLYRGERLVSTSSATRKRWYAISGVILVVCVLTLIFRPLNLGIEFSGGSVFTFKSDSCSVSQARDAAIEAGAGESVDRHRVDRRERPDDPGADRVPPARGVRRGRRVARRGLRRLPRRGQRPGGRALVGRGDHQQGLHRPRGLPGAHRHLPVGRRSSGRWPSPRSWPCCTTSSSPSASTR